MLKNEDNAVVVEPGQVQAVGTMEFRILRNLSFPIRCACGVYRYRLLRMLCNRLILLHRHPRFRHDKIFSSKLGERLYASSRLSHLLHRPQCLERRSLCFGNPYDTGNVHPGIGIFDA